MASLNAVIVPAKVLKNGKHKIRISLAHNGETRYFVTDIVIESAREFKNGSIVKRPDAPMLNTKIRGIMMRYQESIDELEYIDGLTCAELVCLIKNTSQKKSITLQAIFDEYLSQTPLKKKTQETYKQSFKSISDCLGASFMLKNLTYASVCKVDKFLRDSKLMQSSIKLKMSVLLILVSYAQKCGYVQYKIDPFSGYKCDKGVPRQSWLTVEEIKLIRDIKTNNANVQLCRDLFMLSYYLGGVNIIDLIKINFNENVDTIKYERQKTERIVKINKYVEFDIPNEAKEIISRIKGKDGRIDISDKRRANLLDGFFGRYFKDIEQLTGIKKIIYYSARKSFSQHAFNLGINTPVIDFILGHKVDRGGSALFSYISVTPEMATNAIRKVLDNLK